MSKLEVGDNFMSVTDKDGGTSVTTGEVLFKSGEWYLISFDTMIGTHWVHENVIKDFRKMEKTDADGTSSRFVGPLRSGLPVAGQGDSKEKVD